MYTAIVIYFLATSAFVMVALVSPASTSSLGRASSLRSAGARSSSTIVGGSAAFATRRDVNKKISVDCDLN